MPVDILAIAAHRDDIELTCGGALIKMRELGYTTGIVDLTQGEKGTRGSAMEREREALEAAKVLGVSVRENLNLPDAKLQLTMEAKMALAQKIRDLKPRVAILPYWDARHPDHYMASHIGYEACFIAGLSKMELQGQAHRPYKIVYSTMYRNVEPTFIIDITAQFDKRLEAILRYKSQFPDAKATGEIFPPLDNLIDQVNTICHYYGSLIGAKYGEPYLTKEVFKVDDLMKLAVRSI